jgi:hypothetical protein
MTVLVTNTTRFYLGLCGSLTLLFAMPGFMVILRLLRCSPALHDLSWHRGIGLMSWRWRWRWRRCDGPILLLSVSSHVWIHRLGLRLIVRNP